MSTIYVPTCLLLISINMPVMGENMAMPILEKSLSLPKSPPYFWIIVKAIGSIIVTPADNMIVPMNLKKK